MLICKMCEREAENRECFYQLSWKHVDIDEYNARCEDGRTTSINYVCADCLYSYSGVYNVGLSVGDHLKRINDEREQNETSL